MKKIFLAALVMFLVQMAAKADAASISLVPGGSGVYVVKGYNFVDVSGIEIEFEYDRKTLANPKVIIGKLISPMGPFVNLDCTATTCRVLHSIKLAGFTLSTVTGTGDVATITFDVIGSSPGAVSIVYSKLTDGKAQTVKLDTTLPAETTGGGTTGGGTTGGGTTGGGTTGGGTTGGGVSVSGGSAIGTITLPPDQVAAAVAERKAESEPLVTDLRKDMTLPLGDSGDKKDSSEGKKTEADKKEQQQKSVSYKSTLQLFKEFKGERSTSSLIPLFAELSIPDFTQEPSIALSDGKTPVKITLTLKQSGSEAPKFLLQGANVKQLGGEGEGTVTWTIEVLPKKDAVEATLTVIDGKIVMDFPLTVVPQVDTLLTKSKTLSEADFAAYLAKPSKFDLNRDGKFDAVDDYIYTANYIVALKIKPEKAKKEEKKEAPKPAAKDDGKAMKPGTAVKDEKKKPAEKTPLKP